MEIKYIPGDNLAFITFIKEKGVGVHAHLRSIEGHFRWVIDDEEEYIARPQESEDAN